MIKFEPGRTLNGRDVRRAAVRHGWSHVLSCISIAASLADGDMVHGIILMAIIHANTARLRQSNGDHEYDIAAHVPDDSLRSPVSVYAIAKQLGLPYETVRRHVARLIHEGRCVRVGSRGGVVVPLSAIRDMRPDAFLAHSLDSLQALVAELDRIGALQARMYDESEQAFMIG